MPQPLCLHIVADRLGAWRVHREGDPRPLSTHDTETEAERHARDLGAARVIVHDRYHRVHSVPGCTAAGNYGGGPR